MPRDGMREFFVTRAGTAAASLTSTAEHLGRVLAANVVAAECFGPSLNGDDESAAGPLPGRLAIPLTWLQGGTSANGLGGVHLRAVAGAEVRSIELDGCVVGTVVEGPHAVECLLGGVHSADLSAASDRQARATFELIEQALGMADMDFSHVARTWLFLDDILSWYGDFNRVRTAFFTERGVFDGLVPASTGIGGSNPADAAVVAAVYAVKATNSEVTVQAVPSPLQCPALQYGSSFSRAVEVTMPDLQRLLISGTASIGPDGQTRHQGDAMAQTARTCEVVEAILQSRGMGWENVSRATAYVRSGQDAGVLQHCCAARAMPPLPVVVAQNVICRDDLLFELEIDAVRTRVGEP